ncbi:Signal transduction histidine kinase [Pseudosulfitobacter pseudonitzschiae]|nr:PAS domain-containing sensor histidine kinase [Pseudosulfitobacter pseudonitzschiae]QKS07768.1 response regulator [Pseudosulfitobacter pseudonitzschiae]SHF24734.1 Signal transduction histidine kinase [Pseudosulfitobacter pseudonitzschiae]
MAARPDPRRIDVLASIGSARITGQIENPALVQSTLEELVASDGLIGARAAYADGQDIVVGKIDGDDDAVTASAPFGSAQNGTSEPLGTLTLYGPAKPAGSQSLLLTLLIVLGILACLLAVCLAFYALLNRSVLRPLDEMAQELKETGTSRHDHSIRFSENTQNHMTGPLREIAALLETKGRSLSKSDPVSDQQHHHLARTVAIAQMGYATLDIEKKRFISCDPAFAGLLDREVDDVLKSESIETLRSDLVLDFDETESAARREAIILGKSVDETYRIIRHSGEIRYIRVLMNPVSRPGQDPQIVELVGQDVTEQRLAELRANQADRISTIGNLTGGVAHDFNNLLAIISGNIELAALAHAPKERLEYIDNALTAVARGAALTQQLLAFARNQPLSPKIIGVKKLVTDMLPAMRAALGPNIQIVEPDGPENWMINADAAKLETCLMNIVGNAADAMPQGGTLTISLSNRDIDSFQARQMPGSEPGEYVCIELADTGTGMSRAVAAKAFDPFFTTKNVGKGTGMGLSMVLGFAQQSGGFTSLHTVQGRGTAVRIFLPRANSTVVPDTSDAMATEAPSDLLKGCHVLLIEDEDQLRLLYATKLESFGCKVTQASTGEKTLELARTMDPPDIILSDIILPGAMNGIDTADALVKYFPNATVIFISGFSQNAAVHNGMLAMGRMLLQKPFTRAKLAATLFDAISQRTTHGNLPEGPNE